MRMQYLPRTKILHLLGKAMVKPIMVHPSIHQFETKILPQALGDYDGRGQQTASECQRVVELCRTACNYLLSASFFLNFVDII